MTTDSKYVLVARAIFAFERASADDHRVAASRLFVRLFDELAPLVGERGVIAVFARSTVHAKKRYDGLAKLVITVDSLGAVGEALRKHFDVTSVDQTTRGAVELCATFLELMSRLVGQDLILQLIQRAWPDIDVMKEIP